MGIGGLSVNLFAKLHFSVHVDNEVQFHIQFIIEREIV